jgi:hypothetical protein
VLDVLRDGTEAFFSTMPGFVSSSVLTAKDGRRAIIPDPQYAVRVLLWRYGRNAKIPDLLRRLSADCPRRLSVSGCDMGGVHCPGMAELFAPRNAI